MEERSDKGFRKLIVWQRAHQLALLIYKLTEKFPKSEIYGLTSQVRRAAVSVPANIAEGYGYGRKDKLGVSWILLRDLFLKLNTFLYFPLTYTILIRMNMTKAKPCVPKLVFFYTALNKA